MMLANADHETPILLAEKAKRVRASSRALLESEGYTVVEADSEAACIAALESFRPAIVLLGDLDSSQPITQFVTRVKRMSAAPILVMHDESDVETLDSLYEAGMDDCVPRSPSPRMLRHRLQRLLESRRFNEWQQKLQASEERYQQLLNSALLAEALSDIGAALNTSLDLETIMSLILDTVGLVVPHDAANIMQIEGNSARVTHMRGYPERLSERLRTEVYPLAQIGNFQRMVATREPCLLEDTHSSSNWSSLPEWRWIRAYLGAPIQVEGEVIGFINLDSRTSHAFTPHDIARLQAFANQVATALRNAQLYEALRQDTEEFKMLHRATALLISGHLFAHTSLNDVGAHIAETVVNEFGQLDCGVMIVDADCNQLIRLARAGEYGVHTNNTLYLHGAGLVPEAVRTAEIIYAPDVRRDLRYVANDTRTCSELVLPLHTSKGIIGVLDLQSSVVDAFSEQDRRVLRIFSELAAAAMENIMLVEDVRHYNSELEERVGERTAELYHAKERVEAILHNSGEAIIMLTQDGIIQQTNRSFDSLFSYPVDGAFGQPVRALVHESSRVQLDEAFAQVVRNNRAARLEAVAQTAGGGTFDADLFLSPIAERDQRVLSVVASVRDITARKRMEAELRNALERERELNEIKSRFISTANHEFRTPLSMILTSTDMLLKYGERMTAEQKQERIERIQKQVAHMTEMLDDMLNLNNAGGIGQLGMKPEAVDFAFLCTDVVNEVQTSLGAEHRILFECYGESRKGIADPRLLRQVLLNLLINAVKYSLPGSTIYFTLYCEDTYKIIQVRDEGIGIPEDEQHTVFEPFYRARNVGDIGGTGLGLAIVQHAVNLHSGSITVESRSGIGTTFTVTLPLQAKEPS